MGTETEELDHEDSVGPWQLFPRRKREIRGGRSELSREESINLSLQVRPPHGPRQLVRADRKTLFCGRQILWRGE